MTWKRTLAAYAATFAAGAVTFGWLTRPEVAREVAPEVGRPTALSAGWETTARNLRTEVAQMSAQDARALAEKYGDALVRATVKDSLSVPKPGAVAPNRGTAFPRGEDAREWTVEDVAAGIESGAISVLAERSFGPGPRGDEIDVLAVHPCDGCAVELVGKWADPPKLAHPLWRVEYQRFFEIGAAYSTSGPSALIAGGVDLLRVRRVTLGLRAGALVSADPAAWVAVSGRYDFDGD